jgi:phosphotransferase system IIA component
MRKVNSVEILLHLGIDLLQQVGEDTERQFSTKFLSCDELRHDPTLIKERLDTLFDIWVTSDLMAIL